jgi:hypothetical protein
MPTKFLLDIPKFEANPNEDPGDHVTIFHLWCSSNSLKDDSAQLRLFQCTLIGSARNGTLSSTTQYTLPSMNWKWLS